MKPESVQSVATWINPVQTRNKERKYKREQSICVRNNSILDTTMHGPSHFRPSAPKCPENLLPAPPVNRMFLGLYSSVILICWIYVSDVNDATIVCDPRQKRDTFNVLLYNISQSKAFQSSDGNDPAVVRIRILCTGSHPSQRATEASAMSRPAAVILDFGIYH